MLRAEALFAVMAVMLAWQAHAVAQHCEGGRAATPEGYCCWPGQRWDPSLRVCAGEPSCGLGFERSGDGCAPVTAPPIACEDGRTATPEGYCCWPGQHFARDEGGCAGWPRCPVGMHARDTECVVDRAEPRTSARAQGGPAEPPPMDEGTDDEEDRGSVFFRSILHAGYAHFVYLTSERNGGGPVLGAGLTIGWRAPGGVYVGGSFGFEPILAANGQTGATSGRAPWGPTFTPRGYLGVTVGYASGILEVDATLALGGGGNASMGGFGVGLIPTLGLSFVNAGSVHFGVALRPSLAILYDFGSSRGVVDVGVTGGLAFSFR